MLLHVGGKSRSNVSGVILLGLQNPRQHTRGFDLIEGHHTFGSLALRLAKRCWCSGASAMVAERLADAICDRGCIPTTRGAGGAGATSVVLPCLFFETLVSTQGIQVSLEGTILLISSSHG